MKVTPESLRALAAEKKRVLVGESVGVWAAALLGAADEIEALRRAAPEISPALAYAAPAALAQAEEVVALKKKIIMLEAAAASGEAEAVVDQVEGLGGAAAEVEGLRAELEHQERLRAAAESGVAAVHHAHQLAETALAAVAEHAARLEAELVRIGQERQAEAAFLAKAADQAAAQVTRVPETAAKALAEPGSQPEAAAAAPGDSPETAFELREGYEKLRLARQVLLRDVQSAEVHLFRLRSEIAAHEEGARKAENRHAEARLALEAAKTAASALVAQEAPAGSERVPNQ